MSTPAIASATPLVAPVTIKRILFATDFSECSLKAMPFATGLARKFGSSLYLCHVVTPTPLALGAPEAAPYLYEAEIETASEALRDILESKAISGVDAKTMMPAGPLSDQLEAVIRENKIDLLVTGTHGRTGFKRLVMGSSAEEICRIATCPVLTVGPDITLHQADLRHILVPTDLSEESSLAAPYVALLAKAYKAKVTVLHVMPEDIASNPEATMLAEPLRRTMMHEFEGEIDGINPEFVIAFGETAPTVLDWAWRNKVDLIAMGIRSEWLHGIHLRSSLAYRVMSGAHCPVLTCR
jgi:nucleotide-binding universal stress UspA family protein